MSLKKIATFAAISLAAGVNIAAHMPEPTRRTRKPCLHCGTEHDHNNSFCSPECCRDWRAEKAQGEQR